MSLRSTMICDNCNTNFMLQENYEMPPYWIGCQIVVSNKDGEILIESEEASFFHFCSQECFSSYAGGKPMKKMIASIDNVIPQEKDEDDDDDDDDFDSDD